MFGGNSVRDEFGLAAAFPEMGSGASFATAPKLLDAVSLLPGNYGEQSDAPSAYAQSQLFAGMKGDNCPEAWIELPNHNGQTNGKSCTQKLANAQSADC